MELGWPLPKRKKFLQDLVAQKSDKTHPVPFQGKMQYMQVHTVPLDLPLYRLENGRTASSQAEYISTHSGVPEDFFRADNELKTAQTAQHGILTKLARGPKNLFKEFEKHPQSEPIILSSVGYVVNGNRRLSAWREFYHSDPEEYKHFRNVEAVILPHCDERELDRLEAELQLKEDLKAEYGWTSKALMLKEKIQRHKYKEDEVASVYNLTKKGLKELFDCIDYAEQYLESRDSPNRFSEVDDKEYAFRQICRTRPKIRESESAKELFEKSAFCLADEAGEGKRIYAEIPKIAEHLNEVKESLVSELNVETDGADEETVILRVVEALEQNGNFEKARLTIRDTIEAEAVKKRNRKKQTYVLTQIEKARSNLKDALSAVEKRSSKKGAAPMLSDIQGLVEKLREWAETNDE